MDSLNAFGVFEVKRNKRKLCNNLQWQLFVFMFEYLANV